MKRVLLVEDDSVTRTLFELYIKNSSGYRLVESIESAYTAELYCMRNAVDLVLMDVCTGLGASGLEAAAKIKKNCPGIKVIIITSQPECDFMNRARAAKVDSFWYKDPTETGLLSVMDQTMAGISVYPEAAPAVAIGEIKSSELSAVDLRILRELTGGDTDEEIAEHLHLSPWTVRKYIKTMLEKTGFKSRTQLAVAARTSGLVIREY